MLTKKNSKKDISRSETNSDKNIDEDYFVCTSTHKLIEYFQNYLNLMNFLKPISFEIYKGFSFIFEFYVNYNYFLRVFLFLKIYFIYNTFVSDNTNRILFNEININNKNISKDEDNPLQYLENAHEII